MTASLRLRLDAAALVANWRTLAAMSGRATCGAAVKADGYGLGALGVVERLAQAGCRDFFVATWDEAEALSSLGLDLSVLHGVLDSDMVAALGGTARPVLNSAEQVARWRAGGGGRCDVMVDTGMNRLGVSPEEVGSGLLDGLAIETLLSHLACADEDHAAARAMNRRQRDAFAALAGRTSARRLSLANSAGIALGEDYAFDLTRPGLAIYGGVPRADMAGRIAQVVRPEARIVQRRTVEAGETVGYNATWTALETTEVAILNIGYADGYWRGVSGAGVGCAGKAQLSVIGRVSMDLMAVSVDAAVWLKEGDWIALDYALPEASEQSEMSQYELLTGLGGRFQSVWTA